MNDQDVQKLIEQSIREMGQFVISKTENKNQWQNTILAIIGVVGAASALLMFVMDAQIDKKNAPIKTELSVLKNDFKHIRSGVEKILEKVNH